MCSPGLGLAAHMLYMMSSISQGGTAQATGALQRSAPGLVQEMIAMLKYLASMRTLKEVHKPFT